jgi:hypothetical protein
MLMLAEQKVPGMEGSIKSPILKWVSCCWKFYYVQRYLVNFSMRMLKIKSKIKTGLNKVVVPSFFHDFKRFWNICSYRPIT